MIRLAIPLLLITSPALAQGACPAGTVPAYATVASQLKGTSQHSGCVRKGDCRRALPPFWRPDMGWVRSSYACR